MYPEVDPQPSFPKIEDDVLAWWAEHHTFEESIRRRADADEFVFYDGPPFANGLPHYGHLLTGFVKDAVPRYQTMRGRRVERRFGWDCHGLPAEVVVEKELGISGHPEINVFGIDKFNDACRTSVLRFTDEWKRYVTRQARWVDFDNDYKTLDLTYMESVMWAFKTLWDKGLIYEGFKVLAYCWRCETPLSNTETRMDDVYRDRQDPALTVQFQLESGERMLAWTTTPWTLPSNLALAVGPDIDYAVMEEDGVRYILAESRLGAYERELANAVHVETIQGSDLVGRRYTPLFPFFADTPNAFQVIGGSFVSTEDGTGVVHMAPGFGEDDQIAANAVGIPTICPMDEHGRFTADVPPWAGIHVFDANAGIVKELKDRGAVVRHDTYNHSYPHCWRCAEPLVYRAISSWFVQVSSFRDRMGELNQQIQWVPEHVKDGSFGKWLANARDWSISRNRFWGSPIPVWRSDDPNYPRTDVYGSIADLERDFGVKVDDLHRPQVDNLVRPNPDDPTGRSTMRRVTEVLDCWFESGSMPFAQVHYPFENSEWFESHYPGDFIVEYMAQTRGWFYTLHVLATALFDRPAFRTCISHGVVLGDDGQKMSKSLNNYPDPMMVFDTYGADAMRWYLLSSPILRGGDLAVTETGIRESVRHVVLPIWNTYSFFTMYANAAGYTAQRRTESEDPLDQYILGKLHALVADVTESMDAYDLFAACGTVRTFLDGLTNWYVRRSRERFWAGRSCCARRPLDRAHHDVSGLRAIASTHDGSRASRSRRRRHPAFTSPTGRRAPDLGRVACCRGGNGPHPRRVQCVVSGSQGRGPTGAPTIGQLDHRGSRCRIARALPWHHRRRDQRQRRGSVDRSRRRRQLRAQCRAGCSRSTGRQRRAEGDRGRQAGPVDTRRRHRSRHGRRHRAARRRVLAPPRCVRSVAGDHPARQHRCRGARHRSHSGARGRRCRPRSGAIGAAGPARCRPARQRPHRAPPRCTRLRSHSGRAVHIVDHGTDLGRVVDLRAG